MSQSILLLLVEDEPLILVDTEDALVKGGYNVIAAATADEAIAALNDSGRDLAGIITDIRLGSGATGWDVARLAREISLNIPVVYATADSVSDWPIHGVPNSLIVQKPYAAAQLLTAISTLITEADTRNAT